MHTSSSRSGPRGSVGGMTGVGLEQQRRASSEEVCDSSWREGEVEKERSAQQWSPSSRSYER